MRTIGAAAVVVLALAGPATARCLTRTTEATALRTAPAAGSPVEAHIPADAVVEPGRQRAGWVMVTSASATGWVANTATALACGDTAATARDLPATLLALGKRARAGDQEATDRLALAFASGTTDGPGDSYSTSLLLYGVVSVRPRSVVRSLDGLTDEQARSLLHAIFNGDPDPASRARRRFSAVAAEPDFAGSVARRVWPADRMP